MFSMIHAMRMQAAMATQASSSRGLLRGTRASTQAWGRVSTPYLRMFSTMRRRLVVITMIVSRISSPAQAGYESYRTGVDKFQH